MTSPRIPRTRHCSPPSCCCARVRRTQPPTAAPPSPRSKKKAYPDLAPEILDALPDAVFKHALAAARTLGWNIVSAVPGEGRLEATDTTFWFGFKDDVVVRVVAEGTRSRVDVRSVSRVGRSDVGANARRIRAFLKELRAQVAAAGL